jgi:hypothetical protein
MTAAEKKKRQTILAASLGAVVIALAVWDFHGTAAPVAQPPRPHVEVSALQHASTKMGLTAALPSIFHIQFERLARSEGMDYDNNGRSLFGGPPVVIEKVIAPVRPAQILPPAPTVAAKPEPPPIDVKYAGFAESEPGKLNGLFMRGDDISVARTGDIIFHRFKVGSIQEGNAQLTDMVSNQSQRIAATSK